MVKVVWGITIWQTIRFNTQLDVPQLSYRLSNLFASLYFILMYYWLTITSTCSISFRGLFFVYLFLLLAVMGSDAGPYLHLAVFRLRVQGIDKRDSYLITLYHLIRRGSPLICPPYVTTMLRISGVCSRLRGSTGTSKSAQQINPCAFAI